MRNRQRLQFRLLGAALAASLVCFVAATPQGKGKSVEVAIKGVRSKGASKAPSPPVFKSDRTDRRNPGATSKSGVKSTYQVIKNPTSYYVYVWMDDEYICSISPYGTATAWQPAGTHKLFAESAAGTVSWGPKQYEFVPGQTFTWTLN